MVRERKRGRGGGLVEGWWRVARIGGGLEVERVVGRISIALLGSRLLNPLHPR